MIDFMGVEYSRGATATVRDGGPALAPRAVQKMFPDADWTIVPADTTTPPECVTDRFGDCAEMQRKIYAATPSNAHILIGGDHSVNFGHFARLADNTQKDLCLIYIDAHLDIHNPASSQAEASGAPHGTNVRALLGDGDARWLALQKRTPALKPRNLFYLGTRSYEPAEIKYVRDHKIFMRSADELRSESDWLRAANDIRKKIGERPFVVSFDFDAIDPKYFKDVWVPEPNGISLAAAEYFVREFSDANGFEFVEYAPSGDKSPAETVRTLVSIAANQ